MSVAPLQVLARATSSTGSRGPTHRRDVDPELTASYGSGIRRRLHVDAASRDELCACLDHVLEVAGNASLMTSELLGPVRCQNRIG
jgi:hypothetical protein